MIIDERLLERVCKKTFTDYEPYNTKRIGKVLVDTDGIIAIIEDLLLKIDELEEEKEDMKDYYEAHYQYVPEEIPDCER